jgi:AmmeMemoRadiSam system protein B
VLVLAGWAPHAPILLPTVSSPTERIKVGKTIEALERLGREVTAAKPEVMIISSPHPDWGFEVPLYFLKLPIKIQKFLTDARTPREHFDLGKKIYQKFRQERVAWIASGDLSHKLKKEGPYGFDPAGPEFDQRLISLLKKKDVAGILNLEPEVVEQAGECGYRSFCMALGAVMASGKSWQPKILSYEGPFGVGYLVARLK